MPSKLSKKLFEGFAYLTIPLANYWLIANDNGSWNFTKWPEIQEQRKLEETIQQQNIYHQQF